MQLVPAEPDIPIVVLPACRPCWPNIAPTTCPRSLDPASQFPGNALVHQPVLLDYIVSDRIASNAQLDGALEYLGALGAQPLDIPALEEAAGVDVVVRTVIGVQEGPWGPARGGCSAFSRSVLPNLGKAWKPAAKQSCARRAAAVSPPLVCLDSGFIM